MHSLNIPDVPFIMQFNLFIFSILVSFATQVPYFGGPDVVLQDVQCNGTEFSLTDCPSPGVGFTDSNCTFPIYIAGVRCQQGNDVMTVQSHNNPLVRETKVTFSYQNSVIVSPKTAIMLRTCKEDFFVLFLFIGSP